MLVDVLVCVFESVKWRVDNLFLKTQACVCKFINKNIAVRLKGNKKAQVQRAICEENSIFVTHFYTYEVYFQY